VLRSHGAARRFVLGRRGVGRLGGGLLKRCWPGGAAWIHGMVFLLGLCFADFVGSSGVEALEGGAVRILALVVNLIH
jgi:hypothetical protein